MPALEDTVRLRHMQDAACKALAFVKGRTRADLDNDEMLTLALIRLLEILGEAAKNVSTGIQEQYPHLPWKQIAGTRDRPIHGYFDVEHRLGDCQR